MDPTIPPLPAPVPVAIGDTTVLTYTMDADQPDPAGDVVFCHGTPWSAQVWADAAQHLSAGFRVFLWDMPGYGRSTKDPAVAVDLASQMSRFAQLLEHWQLDRPHVVAHDIGGAVALGAHLLHGRDYAGLYLWDVVTLDPWGSPFFELVADHADVFAALPGNLHAALVNEYIAGAAGHELAPEWVRALTQPWLGDEGQSAFYRQIAALRPHHTHPLVERLHQSRCPVAIGWGEQDPWIPVEQATRLQRSLPDAPSPLTLSGVGHLAPIEAPARVRSALDAWLAADGPPRRSIDA
jgi:pimeloyl-ACP methyl ester carboxylesterase